MFGFVVTGIELVERESFPKDLKMSEGAARDVLQKRITEGNVLELAEFFKLEKVAHDLWIVGWKLVLHIEYRGL